jgi:hypothetical protein
MYDDDVENFYFVGWVDIRMYCNQSTDNITLHSNKLNITSAITVWEEGNNNTELYEQHDFDLDRQFLIINTIDKLMAGSFYHVNVTFRGPLKADMAGLYLSSYYRGNDTM